MKNIKTIFRMLRQEIYVLSDEQKKKSIFLFIIIFIGSLFQMLGVTAVLPFISSLMDTNEFRSKWYVSAFVSIFGIENDGMLILLTALFVIIIYIIKNAYLIWASNMQLTYRYKFQRDLSVKMLKMIMMRPYEYFLNTNSAEILRSINGDVIGVYGVYELGFSLLSELLSILMIGAFLIFQDWFMATGVLLVAGICFAFVTILFRVLLKDAGKKQRQADIISQKYAYQIANGIKEINVMKKNSFFVDKYEDAYTIKSKYEKKYYFLSGCPEKIIETSCIIGLLIVICLRLKMGVNTSVFIPQLSVFAVAAFRILPSISKMVGHITGLIYQRPNLESAYNNIIAAEKNEHIQKEYIEANLIHNKEKDVRFKRTLEIRGIDWTYPNSEKKTLCGTYLTINKGESVGFIGQSGSGKTTLSDIIMGLFKPQTGDVFMDDIDIFSIPEEWSRIIGYVPQNIFLTDDTIRNNIGFGVEEENIDDSRVWDALKQAQLKSFVENLPDKLDTIVGERGIRFSGGQRQRIAIARALYYDPDILVFDEATSALDSETENAIMESIDALSKHKTLIIIAHRVSTLKNCDKVFEIESGKAVLVDKSERGI